MRNREQRLDARFPKSKSAAVAAPKPHLTLQTPNKPPSVPPERKAAAGNTRSDSAEAHTGIL